MNTLDDISADLMLFDDWDARYAYIVELGEQLPPLPEQQRREANRVKACMSKVWVHARLESNPSEPETSESAAHVHFDGDCDTAVIKGVLAILIALSNGRTVAEMEALDVDQVFEQLQLANHLSPNRHVGIYAIVAKMKQQVAALSSAPVANSSLSAHPTHAAARI